MTLRFAVLLSTLIACSSAHAEAPSHGPELDAVLTNLSKSATPEQVQQITQAIEVAPMLVAKFDELARAHLLTAIEVAQPVPGSRRGGGMFNGYTDGSKLTMNAEFLTALRKDRYFDVVRPDDVLPNNTVFVLAHLAHHLQSGGTNMKAMATAPNPDAYIEQRLRDEAAAYIDAWNATVDEATRRNGHPLSLQQVGSLLLNSRYRFAFLGQPDKQIKPPSIANSGTLEMNEQNLKAIMDKLKGSAVADLE